jgi:hypothetical protein
VSLFSRIVAAFKTPVADVEAGFKAVEHVVVDAVDAVKGSPAVQNDLQAAKAAFEAAVAAAKVSVTDAHNKLQALVQAAEADAAAGREALRAITAMSPVQPAA